MNTPGKPGLGYFGQCSCGVTCLYKVVKEASDLPSTYPDFWGAEHRRPIIQHQISRAETGVRWDDSPGRTCRTKTDKAPSKMRQ
jgi:hypothetical protein